MIRVAAAIALLTAAVSPARAALDLSRASVEKLDNGLTLILLEDRTFPVVSIQTVYRTGAKDDPAGRLGLAHFFEHMAFRGSKNFPGTGLVSEIYAVGGEWHGYTWIDLTTYFATTPKERLDLLLDIEADRMARLDIKSDEVEAERGAVLSEMNGYLNDPDSTLFDALIAAHFLTHPYRNNTIGFASDIGAVSHTDLVEFYRRHYAPQNAVIALVGDFDSDQARAAVRKRFGAVKKKVEPHAPLTAEIPRTGERRVRLSLPSQAKLFKIAYPAPAASHKDFPAYLVLQALLGGSAGVNFNQNDWGTPVNDASPFKRAAADIRTWVIPTAEDYAFVISGSAPEKAKEAAIEKSVQRALDRLSTEPVSDAALLQAKALTLKELAFDLDTTEEAAHQLAYFAGIGALDQLLRLDEKVGAVTAEDVAAVAKTYLRHDLRTIAWLTPGNPAPVTTANSARDIAEKAGAADRSPSAPEPVRLKNSGQAAVFFQQSALSPTVTVAALLAGRYDCDRCSADEIAFGTTSIAAAALRTDAATAFRTVLSEIETATERAVSAPSNDPMVRLEQAFASYSALERRDNAKTREAAPRILTLAISGDLDAASAQKLVDEYFPHTGDADEIFAAKQIPLPSDQIDITIDRPLAQAAVGYIAAAPGPSRALATRLALYILSHGYEGRLGKEAISRQGLLYYIDAAYRPFEDDGYVTLAGGVDPGKIDAYRNVLKLELERLQTEPPTDAEIAEAKRHLLGRKVSAAQSNAEIADALLRQSVYHGAIVPSADFKALLDAVSRQDVLDAIEALMKGAVVTVRGRSVD